MTSELDLRAYLLSKSVQFWQAGGDEISAHCMFGCTGSATRGRGKLYFNTDTWLYTCMVCQNSGNRRTLLQHFGDEDEIQHAGQASDPMLRRRILSEAADVASEMLIASEKHLQMLLDRGISGELIVSHKLGYVPKNFGLTEALPVRSDLQGYTALIASGVTTVSGKQFFSNSITIPYFSHGTVIQVRSKDLDPGGRYRTAANDPARLYNADALFGADDVLLCEGELDGLAALSTIMDAPERTFPGLAVVALAGVNSWPDGLIETLSHARRVFICMDPDDAGRKAAHKLAEEIGTKARIIELPNEGQDMTDWLKAGHSWRDIRDLMVEADLAGKQLFSARDLASKWATRQKEAPGLKLGWPSIDSVLRPGLKPGQVLIPLATTGTGKSAFLSNIAHNVVTQKVGTLIVSLEMTGEEIWEHLRRIHRFHNPKAQPEQMYEDYSLLRVVERNRLGAGALGELIQEFEDDVRVRPGLMTVDYLQYYARGFRGNSMYERVGDAIMEEKAVAKEEKLAIISPSQVNRGGERGKPLGLNASRDAGTVEETGDFVISLFRPDQVEQPDGTPLPLTGAFNLGVLKSRHGGVGRVANLKFSNMSLAMTDAVFDKPGSARIEQENSLYRQGVSYLDIRQAADDVLAQGVLV